MTYVLVHGATFAASCWDLLVPYLDDDVIAIDLPGRGSRAAFCNDMDDQQAQWTLAHMGPEAPGVMIEPVDLAGLDTAVARSWIRLLQDALIAPDQQSRCANRIGADVIDLDAGHMAMISRPQALAAVLRSLRDGR